MLFFIHVLQLINLTVRESTGLTSPETPSQRVDLITPSLIFKFKTPKCSQRWLLKSCVVIYRKKIYTTSYNLNSKTRPEVMKATRRLELQLIYRDTFADFSSKWIEKNTTFFKSKRYVQTFAFFAFLYYSQKQKKFI